MKAVYENKIEPLDIFFDSALTPTPHLHKEIELVYIYSGNAVAVLDQKCYSLKTGDLFVAFPNQIHYYLNSSIGEYCVTIISPDILYDIKNIFTSKLPQSCVINSEECPEIKNIFNQINCRKTKYFNTMVCGNLNLLFSEILPILKPETVKIQNNPAIADILDYCSKNFSNDLDLDSISNELHLSKYYISHLLNKHLGLNFNDYINRLRIKKACELIIMTNKKIADISEEVGFGTIRSFNRAFKSVMNITPGNYRKLQQ